MAWVALLVLAVGSFAQGQTALSAGSEPCVAACLDAIDHFVAGKLAAWQKRLKLDDWKVSVVMARREQLKRKTLGGIRWNKPDRTAVISVLDPSEYRLPLEEMFADIEFTIVHELVHLELASLPRSEASRSNEEFAVNQLTAALLELEREAGR